jgi:hypothetical protein
MRDEMQSMTTANRPSTLFHATTPAKAKTYRNSGRIIAPVRGFTTMPAAMAWAMKVGRSVIYQVTADADRFHKLPDHHNEFGDAWWIDADVTDFECAYSAGGAA